MPTNDSTASCASLDVRESDGDERGSETILVAGEDRNVQALIGDVLRRRGYRVLIAGDAWQAVRVAAQHGAPIDLLVTAPGTAGAAVAYAVRERRPDPRALFC